MFDENAFSTDAFSTDSWLFLFEVPYHDITGVQRVFVRSVTEKIYGVLVAEAIVSIASEQNISIVQSASNVVVRRKAKRENSNGKLEKSPRKTAAPKGVDENTTSHIANIEYAARIVEKQINLLVRQTEASPMPVFHVSSKVVITGTNNQPIR